MDIKWYRRCLIYNFSKGVLFGICKEFLYINKKIRNKEKVDVLIDKWIKV